MNHEDLKQSQQSFKLGSYKTRIHGCQDDTSVGVLELRDNALADMLALALVLLPVPSKCIQNGDTTPFGAL